MIHVEGKKFVRKPTTGVDGKVGRYGATVPFQAMVEAYEKETGKKFGLDADYGKEEREFEDKFIASIWPQTLTNPYTDVSKRAEMNRLSWLPEDISAIVSHAAVVTPQEYEQAVKSTYGEKTKEFVKAFVENPSSPAWMQLHDLRHKDGRMMNLMDALRLTDEMEDKCTGVLASACNQAGKKLLNTALADSIRGWTKQSGKDVFLPIGKTSADSKSTAAGMALFPAGGGVPVTTPTTNVLSAINLLRKRQ